MPDADQEGGLLDDDEVEEAGIVGQDPKDVDWEGEENLTPEQKEELRKENEARRAEEERNAERRQLVVDVRAAADQNNSQAENPQAAPQAPPKPKRLTKAQKDAQAKEQAIKAKEQASKARDQASKAREQAARAAQHQLALEKKLLETISVGNEPPKPAQRPRKGKRNRYVAMNPAQQQLVNFLSGPNRDKEMPAIWRAQLCILPIGVQEEVPEPDKSNIVNISNVRSQVLEWSRITDPYLHLSLKDKDLRLDLIFKRCVLAPWVDSDRPFVALNRSLKENDANLFSEAQQQFAEYGVVLIPKAPPSEAPRRSRDPSREARSRSKSREVLREERSRSKSRTVRSAARRMEELWRVGPQAGWDDADEDVRPGGFENMGNSCYFHSAMLMLYQMKDWYSEQVKSSIDGYGRDMLLSLDALLVEMGEDPQLSILLTTPPYNLVQDVLFPRDRNRQQDANEFFTGLFQIMLLNKCNLASITFGAISQTFDPDPKSLQEIPYLVHNAQFVPSNVVEEFRTRWNKLEKKDQDFENWTLGERDGNPEIVRRTNRDPNSAFYQPPIQRASLADPDPTGIDIKNTSRSQTVDETILRVYLPPGDSDVCTLIESAFNEGQDVAVGAKHGFFNAKTIVDYTYTFLPAKFLIVSMLFVPNKMSRFFVYCDTISLQFDGISYPYDLQCVIFRFGCTADSGHFTAALKVGDQWVYYDDSPPSRKLTTLEELSEISGVPFMLLFKSAGE